MAVAGTLGSTKPTADHARKENQFILRWALRLTSDMEFLHNFIWSCYNRTERMQNIKYRSEVIK